MLKYVVDLLVKYLEDHPDEVLQLADDLVQRLLAALAPHPAAAAAGVMRRP